MQEKDAEARRELGISFIRGLYSNKNRTSFQDTEQLITLLNIGPRDTAALLESRPPIRLSCSAKIKNLNKT